MARIRSIKPSFFTDPKVCRLSAHARLLFIATWTIADDLDGVFDARDSVLKSAAFIEDAVTLEEVANWFAELVRERLVWCFHHDGARYAVVRNWGRHQVIHKPGKKLNPDPHPEPLPESSAESPGNSGGISDPIQKSPGNSLPSRARAGGGEGGGEGKEKEGEVPAAPAALSDPSDPPPPSGERYADEVYAFVEAFRVDYHDNVDPEYEFKKPIPPAELDAARAFLNDKKWPADRIQRLKEAVMTDQQEPRPGSTWKGWAFEVRSVAKFREKRSDLEAKLVRGR